VPFVSVHQEIFRHYGHAYDMHENNFTMLKNFNLPLLDQVYPALIEDLEARGLLDETLVIVMGEMGCTPQINSNAGGGRDHWGRAYSVLWAGGGIRPGQVVGSIGVVSASFGFTGLMQKLGVERRLFTAGENKGMLDPFSPLPEQQQKLWQTILDSTHQQFIARVKAGRGKRLVDDPLLFTGMVWSGEQALKLGLIDGLGSAGSVARDIIGAEKIVDVSVGESPIKSLLKNFGMSFGAGFARQLEHMSAALR